MTPKQIAKLSKKDIISLAHRYCRHGHSYLNHYGCLAKESGLAKERVGFFDIETSGLQADYGFIISYAIKELGGRILGRVITGKEVMSMDYDRKLVAEMVRDMVGFDRLWVYWGKNRRFDIPFSRTRALVHGLWFPEYKDLKVNDLYDICRNKLKLRSNRLGVVCDLFGIAAKSHQMTPKIWNGAIRGDKEALEWVWKHNVEDVISTEKLWRKLQAFQRKEQTSI